MFQTARNSGRIGPALCQAATLAAATCAAIALASIMLLMLADVGGRYLFNSPVPGAAEVIELAMGVTVFAALPLVTARNEHIRLDYLNNALKGRIQGLVNALVMTISAAGMGLLAWRIAEQAMAIAQYGDTTPFLRIPIYPIAYFLTLCAVAATVIFIWQSLISWRQAVMGTSSNQKTGRPS